MDDLRAHGFRILANHRVQGVVGSQPVADETADPNEAAEFVETLQMFVDDEARDTVVMDVTNSSTPEAVQSRLEQYFESAGASSAVTLIYRGMFVGVVTLTSLGLSRGTAGGSSTSTGAGDQITLPGESSRYRLLKFVCPQCSHEEYRVFYDPADLPSCHDGPMELRR